MNDPIYMMIAQYVDDIKAFQNEDDGAFFIHKNMDRQVRELQNCVKAVRTLTNMGFKVS